MNDVTALRQFDRRLFLITAVAFPITILVGFGPTYYARGLVAAPLPSLLAVHVARGAGLLDPALCLVGVGVHGVTCFLCCGVQGAYPTFLRVKLINGFEVRSPWVPAVPCSLRLVSTLAAAFWRSFS